MSEKPNKVSEVKKNDPTLFDLINRYFPEPFRKTYMDAETTYKAAQAAVKLKLLPGYRVEDYLDADFVQKIALELHKEFPDMTAEQMALEQMAEHPEVIKRFGKISRNSLEFPQKTFRTIIKHIKALDCIPSNPVGRPKGSMKPICLKPRKNKP